MGFATLGIGFTMACFHLVGKYLLVNEAFIISAKISAVCSMLIFIKYALIPSTPHAFVLIVFTTFLISRPEISENLNLVLRLEFLFFIFVSSSIIFCSSTGALLLERKALFKILGSIFMGLKVVVLQSTTSCVFKAL